MRVITTREQLPRRIEITKAALMEIGRGDLADLVYNLERNLIKNRLHRPPGVYHIWHKPPRNRADGRIIRRAIALSKMALVGDVWMHCDPCSDLGYPEREVCLGIPISDYLIGRVCALRASSAITIHSSVE